MTGWLEGEVGTGRRWLVTVLASLACFGGCWLALAAGRVWDTGTQVGVASVPLVVGLPVLGAWAERGREKKPSEPVPGEGTAATVRDSPQRQATSRDGHGQVIGIGAGATVTNSVIYVGRSDDGKGPSGAEGSSSGRVVAVGDVPLKPPAFQHRAGLLGVLARDSGPRVSVVLVLTGIRGAGKTQVAAAYARQRIADRWRLVAWLDASDVVSVLDGLVQVAAAAGIGAQGEDARVLAERVRHWLEDDGERRLVVFDNAVDLDGLRPFLPVAGAAQVLITSNRRSAANLGREVPVDVFTEVEALAYLAERTKRDDVSGARELAAELGFLPLGLAQAAALIVRERLLYGTYLLRLRALPVADYMGRVEGDTYRYKTAEAIVLSLRSVEDADPSGRCSGLMSLMSLLAETGVSRRVLHLAVGRETAVEDVKKAAAVDAAIGVLNDSSLVEFSSDDVVVAHRLVMRVVREWLAAADALPSVAAETVRVLTRLRDGIAEAWRDPAGVRELAGHVNALTAHAQGHPDVASSTLAAGLLRLRLGSANLLDALGDSTGRAIEAAEPLVADCERFLGADHPTTVTSRAVLASAYQDAGRTAEAIQLLEQALKDQKRLLGTDHRDTISFRSELALAYQKAGRIPEAIALYQRSLADSERVLGTDDLYTLHARVNLAHGYRAAGLTAEAIPLLEQTLSDRERLLGTDHPDTLSTRDHLATAYMAAGLTAKAIPLLEQTLAGQEQLLGTDHPTTLNSRNNLASAVQMAGQAAEAIPLLEQTLSDRERLLGTDHPDTINSRSNLATAYLDAGRIAEAITLFERLLPDSERVLGADHPTTLSYRDNLARSYRAAGRTAKAIALFERLLPDSERVLGADHPTTLAHRNNLGTAYLDAGRIAEAITLFERLLPDSERVLGADHPTTLACCDNLARSYQAAGQTAEAIQLHEQTRNDLERVLGADHPHTLACRDNLAYSYLAAGWTAEAITLFERTLNDRERLQQPDHPAILNCRSNLARSYLAAGWTAEAITLFEQTLNDRERLLGADHPTTLACRSNLALAYLAAEQTAEATTLFERLLPDSERVLGADHPLTLACRDTLSYLAAKKPGKWKRLIVNLIKTVTQTPRRMAT